MSTFANSEDPDEMQLNAAFHQGLHCMYADKKNTIYYENYDLTSLDIYNGLSQVICIKPEARIN